MTIFISLLFALIFSTTPVYSGEKLMLLTEEWRPISFTDQGRADGLSVEVVRQILYRLGLEEEILVVPWARGWTLFMENANVILFTMTRTEEREKMFAMVGPIAIGTTNLYARKGSAITVTSLEDARNAGIIGVYRSAVEEQLLIKAGFTNLESTTFPVAGAKKLMLNRIDLWCNANLTADAILKEAGYSIEDVDNVFTIQENHLYIAFSRGTPEKVVDEWQKALEAIKKDGTFATIYHKWLPMSQPPAFTERIGLRQ